MTRGVPNKPKVYRYLAYSLVHWCMTRRTYFTAKEAAAAVGSRRDVMYKHLQAMVDVGLLEQLPDGPHKEKRFLWDPK